MLETHDYIKPCVLFDIAANAIVGQYNWLQIVEKKTMTVPTVLTNEFMSNSWSAYN